MTIHPKWTAEPDDTAIVEVAMAMKPGMGGWGPLPFAGGYAEQPSKLMQACRYIIGLASKLDQERSKVSRSTPK